jgi:hypothetical protein
VKHTAIYLGDDLYLSKIGFGGDHEVHGHRYLLDLYSCIEIRAVNIPGPYITTNDKKQDTVV